MNILIKLLKIYGIRHARVQKEHKEIIKRLKALEKKSKIRTMFTGF